MEPQDVDALMTRLDRIEARLESLTLLLEHAPALVASVTDVVDEAANNLATTGADMDTRLRGLGQVAAALTEPRTLEGLKALAAEGERLPELVESLRMLPGAMAALVDVADEFMTPERFESARHGLRALGHLLHPDSVEVVAKVGEALSETRSASPPPVGPMGTLKAMWDPDVRSAVGFGVEFARRLGRSLGRGATRLLPSGRVD